MLHESLRTNRNELIARCRAKVGRRFQPAEVPAAVEAGVPLFLLQPGQRSTHRKGVDPKPPPLQSKFGETAALHEAGMLRAGLTISEVVHG